LFPIEADKSQMKIFLVHLNKMSQGFVFFTNSDCEG
jgi:hypothetical protein